MTGIRLLQEMIALGMRATMAPLIVRETLQRDRVTIIAYHRIPAALFEKHLQYLLRHYSVISLDDFVKARYRNDMKSLPVRPVVITFDDGARSNYSLLGVLRRHRIPVTFFVCSDIVGTNRHFWFSYRDRVTANLKTVPDAERLKLLSGVGFDEMREYGTSDSLSRQEVSDLLAAGASIQSHTLTHPVLTMCEAAKAEKEIARSKLDLEKTFGIKVDCFAFPNGDYLPRDIDFCKKAGYLAAVTVDSGFNGLDADVYRLKRISVPDNAGVNQMAARVSGVWDFAKRFFRLKKSRAYSQGTGRFRGSVKTAGMDILFYMAPPRRLESTGMRTHILEVLGNLNRMGHSIRYANGSAYSPMPSDELAPRVDNHRISPWSRAARLVAASPVRGEALLLWSFFKEMTLFLSAARAVIRRQPDVIYRRHSHFSSDYLISRLFGVPLVKEVNAIGVNELRIARRADSLTLWFYGFLERFSFTRADRLMVVTPELKQFLHAKYGVPESKITVIQNGANTDLFQPMDRMKARERLGLSKDAYYICFVGLLKRWQGVEYLLRGMPSILECCPGTRLLIVGDGELKDELSTLARQLGVSESVLFAGRVPYQDVPLFINAGDVCAAPFIRELDEKGGLCSLKMYEYLACGKPCVMSRLKGTETLDTYHCLSLVEPENAPELAQAIVSLLRDEKRRQEMGRNGRRYVVENQSWQSVAGRVAEVLGGARDMALRKHWQVSDGSR